MKKILIILTLLIISVPKTKAQEDIELILKYCSWDASVIDILSIEPNTRLSLTKINRIVYTSDIETRTFVTELALMFMWGNLGITPRDFNGFLMRNITSGPGIIPGGLVQGNIFLINFNGDPVLFFVEWSPENQKWNLFVEYADVLQTNYSHILKGTAVFTLKSIK